MLKNGLHINKNDRPSVSPWHFREPIAGAHCLLIWLVTALHRLVMAFEAELV